MTDKKCYSLTIGSRNLSDSTTAQPEPKANLSSRKFSLRDERTIRKITARYFPEGSTILEASGSWFDQSEGRFIREQSRQILVCAEKREQLKGWYNELCYAMQQKSLMLVELGPVGFINSDPPKLVAIQDQVKATKTTGTQKQKPKTTI